MRKRTFNHILNKLFWHILYILPLIVFIICLTFNVNTSGDSEFNFVKSIDVESAIAQVWEVCLPVSSNNVVSQAFDSISVHFNMQYLFGQDSFLNCFFTYYVYVVIFHILVDVLLFIPKLAHKWIGGFIDEE